MKTKYYKITFLAQNQAMKEYTINHAFNKLDLLLNRAVKDIIIKFPDNPKEGDLYIVNNATLAFFINNMWETLEPFEGMILYVINQKAFFIFDQNKWISI